MNLVASFQVALPDWCQTLAGELPDQLPDAQDRLALAVELSRRNVAAGTGGPFGAVVADAESGKLLALGVNRVEPDCCSSAHAEVVAISLAQAGLGDWNLREHGSLELATSCEPCAMCLGAIHWSGVSRLVCAATKQDAERTGFDEGPRDAGWVAALEQRGIQVVTGVQRDAAARVLESYRDGGAKIYNP